MPTPDADVKSIRPVKPTAFISTLTRPEAGLSASVDDDPLAVITALMLMSLCAVSVSLLALQDTALLTLMSPNSVPLADVAMVTLPVPKDVLSVSAPIPLTVDAPVPALMLKSVGSISHVPLLLLVPGSAAVVIKTSF